MLDQRPDIDQRVNTLLKVKFIIPTIRDHEETIRYIEQLIGENDEITTFELLHAASSLKGAGKRIAENIMIDIDDSLTLEFFPIPKDINNRVRVVLTKFSPEDKQRFSLE